MMTYSGDFCIAAISITSNNVGGVAPSNYFDDVERGCPQQLIRYIVMSHRLFSLRMRTSTS